MAAVVSKFDALAFGPVPDRAGIKVSGQVETRAVVDGAERPILLWMHRLQPGATLPWDAPAQDHLAYVWEGRVTSGEDELGVDEVLVIENRGHGSLTCGAEPAVVL